MEELVFHYCSIDTFFAILSNKTLRLSDVVKSNDNLEVLWMKKVLLEMVERESLSYEEFDEDIKKKISFERYKQRVKEKIDSFFDEKELKSKFFVICFSGDGSEDRLSQWRGYGDDGKGIAIAFDKKIMKKTSRKICYATDSSKIEFKKVEYDLEEQKKIIRNFWYEQVILANKEISNFDVDFELWLVKCFPKLYEQAIFMKNPFFEEEDESRIVFKRGKEKCEFIGESLTNEMVLCEGDIIIRSGRIVEYYDLDISKVKKGFIKRIILGPKCTTEKEDVQMLLEKYKFKGVEVVWSKGSYR